jgi:hypothetical protein
LQNLSVNCFDGEDHNYVEIQCSSWDILLSTKSYFFGPFNITADTIVFVAFWENGKVVKKRRSYHRVLERTKKRINLFATSLYKRPLIGIGKNRIIYTMFYKREKVYMGELTFTVSKESIVRTCLDRTIDRMDMRMCRNSASACNYYFFLEDACNY